MGDDLDEPVVGGEVPLHLDEILWCVLLHKSAESQALTFIPQGLLAFALNLWLFNSNFSPEQCKTLHFLIVPTCMFVVLGSGTSHSALPPVIHSSHQPSTEAILAMRTYAFLGRKRWMGITLVILFLGETAFLLYVSIAGIHQTVLPVVTKGPCTASDKPGKHVVSGFWLAPVAFDLLCTFTTVYKVRIRFPESYGMSILTTAIL
jgi:hypothetical protein